MLMSLLSRLGSGANILLMVLLVSVAGWSGEQSVNKSGEWSGVIINNNCTADEAFAEAEKCTANAPGAKLVLYDDTTREIFNIEPQSHAAGHLGDAVTVQGIREGNTIQTSSLRLLSGIGLPIGQKAPAFTAHDQYGREQTLDSLRGSHGTVLLFFRSADW